MASAGLLLQRLDGSELLVLAAEPQSISSPHSGRRCSVDAAPGPLFNDARGVGAVTGLSWDRSGGAHNGRVYAVYTDSPAVGSTNTNIFVKYSDNNGLNWTFGNNGNPINDDGRTVPHFLPQSALDQTTGNLAAAWYDCHNSLANQTVQVFASVSMDGGITWQPNRILQDNASNSNTAMSTNNFGDYNTMAAHGGNFYPIWADNSGTLNPPPPIGKVEFDMATVSASFAPPPSPRPPQRVSHSASGASIGPPTEAFLLGEMVRRGRGELAPRLRTHQLGNRFAMLMIPRWLAPLAPTPNRPCGSLSGHIPAPC